MFPQENSLSVLNRHWVKQTNEALSDESILTGFDGHFLGRRNSFSWWLWQINVQDSLQDEVDKTRRNGECEYTCSNWLKLQTQKNIGSYYYLFLLVFQVVMISVHVVGALCFIVLYSPVVQMSFPRPQKVQMF